VLDHWRAHAADKHDNVWTRLAYQSIARMEEESLTSVLEEIYKHFESDDYRILDFYWTIRHLEGARVLQLRKRIRAEFGVQRLQ